MRDLTPRELEVIELVANGYTLREVGEELGISYFTAKTHMARVLAKIDARDRAHAVKILMDRGDL
jgi:DNA-binding CsgD family transcriptional regulator